MVIHKDIFLYFFILGHYKKKMFEDILPNYSETLECQI